MVFDILLNHILRGGVSYSDPSSLHDSTQDRFLQNTNATDAESTYAPSEFSGGGGGGGNNGGSDHSDMNPGTGTDSMLAEKEGAMRFGIVLLAALSVVLVFVGWRSFKWWKVRRQRYMLQVQSNRADAVLGDMQMVPNDEYDDDDPELL